jgi:hypothetical protein
MHSDQKQHFLQRIAEREAQRNWSALPQSFEQDAVRGLFKHMKDHFHPQKGIKARIAASKACTWKELRNALASQ